MATKNTIPIEEKELVDIDNQIKKIREYIHEQDMLSATSFMSVQYEGMEKGLAILIARREEIIKKLSLTNSKK
jgi:hypothetical protein